MQVTRRGFLTALAALPALEVPALQLALPRARRIFLPPSKGWPQPGLHLEEAAWEVQCPVKYLYGPAHQLPIACSAQEVRVFARGFLPAKTIALLTPFDVVRIRNDLVPALSGDYRVNAAEFRSDMDIAKVYLERVPT